MIPTDYAGLDAYFWLKLCGITFVICVILLRIFHKNVVMKLSIHYCEPGFIFFRVMEWVLTLITIISGLVSIISLAVIMKIM